MNTALERDSAPELERGPDSIRSGTDADLLAQMIHDIKNPLSAILCYAEIVSDAKDEERREYCDRLQANARAVLDLLDGFGLLVALRTHDVDISLEAFDWVRQTMRVAADLSSVASFRSQRIAASSVGERLVHGDRSKLTVAIRSMLLEGLRVAAPGQTVELNIRATGPDALVAVTVPSDSHEGTLPMFDPSRPALELVAQVADLHHGSLSFRSEDGRAVATISVPLA